MRDRNQYGLYKTDAQCFVKDSRYARHRLKARIIKHNLIEYKCAICKLNPIWQGKPMVLVLDHINGINNDHRLENLRFVCGNCNLQLPTYAARNKKLRRINGISEGYIRG